MLDEINDMALKYLNITNVKANVLYIGRIEFAMLDMQLITNPRALHHKNTMADNGKVYVSGLEVIKLDRVSHLSVGKVLTHD